MTNHRIESLRRNAALLTDRGYTTAAGVLLREAGRIEREQAEEKRIDDYAAEAFRAGCEHLGIDRNWDTTETKTKELYRSITHAILVKCDLENIEVPF